MNEHSKEAVIELFTEVIIRHVPHRFPTMFKLEGNIFKNLITGKEYDTENGLQDAELALRILSENVEEDFYFMVPDGKGEWRFQGYIACFPGGFFSPQRIGESFREIHQPVPGYNERIANGVDKFVQRMKAGELIQRFNASSQFPPSLHISHSANQNSGVSNAMVKTSSAWTATTSTPSKAISCLINRKT